MFFLGGGKIPLLKNLGSRHDVHASKGFGKGVFMLGKEGERNSM